MAALLSLVEFQLKNAQDLNALLIEERAAIASRSTIDIEKLAKDKLTLIEQIQTTDQRIGQHPNVDELKQDGNLTSLVEQINHTIEVCQKENTLNGEALDRAQLSYNRLNNLMQQSQGKIGMTYNADGHTHTLSTLGTSLKA
ncbi:flagella synthesis protein FlgN [Vibrio agarivorans]|uniref:flagella synthesis protein FlgN n=1 Tax=Vibrio agarivorans TaxID=153622 RepID=UPI0022305C01|nr:flagellar export chaperone FlgN [Vibrio agarivorans]MDN3662744.1 flagellar export chaperone FlgN [Vibrio agarivorans]